MKNTRKTNIRRQKVQDTLAHISPWDLSGTPEDICKELRETQDAYLKDYDNIIEASWKWEDPSFGDSTGYFSLIITRLENDNEYDRRVKQLMKIGEQEKILKQKQEKFEYEEYLRLKQKFDKNSKDWKPPYVAVDPKTGKIIQNECWKNDWSSP